MAKSGKKDGLSEAIGYLTATQEEHGKKLDNISLELRATNDILRQNTTSLQEHMLQTKLTQEQNKILKDDHEKYRSLVDAQLKEIEERIKPVEEHVIGIHGLTKLAKLLLPLIGLPAATYYALKIITEFLIKH